jgi:hypothetical protein
MIRRDLSPGSANVAQLITPGFGTGFQVRAADGGTTAYSAGSSARVPSWLKLEFKGGQIRGFESPDGQSWAFTGSTPAFTSPTNTVYAGLAVTSHNTSLLNAATFDNVRVDMGLPPVSPPAPARLSALRLPDGRLRLSIFGSRGATYQCEASPDLKVWTAISTNINESGEIVVYDQPLKDAAQRFYRAVALP